MANHLWLCPTKNKDIFYNPQKLVSFLNENIEGYSFELIESNPGWGEHDHIINIKDDSGNSSAIDSRGFEALLIYSASISEDKEEMIKFADENIGEDIGDNLVKYLDNCELNKCMEIRRSSLRWKDQIYIIKEIQNYFGAIWMDEGIYPQVILPPKDSIKKKKEKSTIVKRFKDWLGR